MMRWIAMAALLWAGCEATAAGADRVTDDQAPDVGIGNSDTHTDEDAVEPEKLEATKFETEDDAIRGAAVEVPDGAWKGDAIRIELTDNIGDRYEAQPGERVVMVGPAIVFTPDGAKFGAPVTMYLPFSTTEYNKDQGSKFKSVAVLVANSKGEVGFEIGPIGMESIGFEIGPIGFEIGPIGAQKLMANEGNKKLDGLFVLTTEHFSTYQVVLIGTDEDPDHN